MPLRSTLLREVGYTVPIRQATREHPRALRPYTVADWVLDPQHRGLGLNCYRSAAAHRPLDKEQMR